MFVFPGLSLAKRDDPFALVDNRPTLRSDGWAYYHRGQVDAAKQSWANVGGTSRCARLGLMAGSG